MVDPKTLKKGDKLVVANLDPSATDLWKVINNKTGEKFKVGDKVTVRYTTGTNSQNGLVSIEECKGSGTWAVSDFRRPRFVETLQPGDEVRVVGFEKGTGLKGRKNQAGELVKVGDVLTVKEVFVHHDPDLDRIVLVEVPDGIGFYALNFRKYTTIEKLCDTLQKQMVDGLRDVNERFFLNQTPFLYRGLIPDPVPSRFYDYPGFLLNREPKYKPLDWQALSSQVMSLRGVAEHWKMPIVSAIQDPITPECPICVHEKKVAEFKAAWSVCSKNWRAPIINVDLKVKPPTFQDGWDAGYRRGREVFSNGSGYKSVSDVAARAAAAHRPLFNVPPEQGTGTCVHCYRKLPRADLKMFTGAKYGHCLDVTACERARCGAKPVSPKGLLPTYCHCKWVYLDEGTESHTTVDGVTHERKGCVIRLGGHGPIWKTYQDILGEKVKCARCGAQVPREDTYEGGIIDGVRQFYHKDRVVCARAKPRCHCGKYEMHVLFITDEGVEHSANACIVTLAALEVRWTGRCKACGTWVNETTGRRSSLGYIFCKDAEACVTRFRKKNEQPLNFDYRIVAVYRVPGVKHFVTSEGAPVTGGDGRCYLCGCVRSAPDLKRDDDYAVGVLICRDNDDCFRCCKARRADANARHGA